tara:strand:+ start:3397 stop:3675 length:279 start_codon:yes stop_codon:yes gene_type:complete
MEMPKVDEVLGELKSRYEDPAKQQLVAALAQDMVRVQSMMMVGDPKAEVEMAHVEAAARGLAAAEQAHVTSVVSDYMTKVLSSVVARAIPGV